MANSTTTIPPYGLHCFLLISLVLLLLLNLFRQRRKAALKKLPPGPNKLPIIGNLHHLGPLIHNSFLDLSNKHGPIMLLQLGSIPTLVVSSGDIAREIFRSNDIAFSGRPNLYASRKLTYGLKDITFAPYGENWRQARKLATIELLSVKKVQTFRTVRQEEVDLLISSIKSLSSSSTPVNLTEILFALANNITSRVSLGKKYGEFYGILSETRDIVGSFCISDFFPWLEWIHGLTGFRARLEKNFKQLNGFYDRVIEEHINSRWPEPEHQDLVHVLLRLHHDPVHGKTFSTMNDVKGILMDMFFAGTDTSSAVLVWTMAELIKNPRVMKKLQHELRKVIGNKITVEEEDLQQLEYLKLVIKESLRLHPPAPVLVPRETIEKCKIQEYDIPAKTRVFINAKAISMDPSKWKNPEEFWPERFLGNSIDFIGQDFVFVPFGGGRRICPGINFATIIIELALANLLYFFNWGLPFGMEVKDLDFEEECGTTMHKKIPLCLMAYSAEPISKAI